MLANVTPSFDQNGKIIGYHSNRRVPRRDALEKVIPLYKALCEEEAKEANRKQGMARGIKMVGDLLADAGMDYDEFVFSL